MYRLAASALLILGTTACASTAARVADTGAMPVTAAATAGLALGTDKGPVKADMPPGQRAYLDRLRCVDGRAPRYARRGNIGPGRDGHIVDLYDVDCGAAAPGRIEIQMDMYHPGHAEARAVSGFTIAAPAGAPNI